CMCAATVSSPSAAPSASRPRCPNILGSSRRWKSATPSSPKSARATTRSDLPPLSRRMARNWSRPGFNDRRRSTRPKTIKAIREKKPMLDTPAKTEAPGTEQELTDGFHLVIDALKLNDVKTIYGVPGIPITDFGRMAQAAGIRVLSFRHEQNAGYAASIAGYLTRKPGVCLTVSAPGFLNGLTALAHATTNCFPMILMSGSSEREIVDLQQGDYEEM